MGWNLKDWRSYGGGFRDMEIVVAVWWVVDLMGVMREVMGVPWKVEVLMRFEERVVVVAMAAIDEVDMLWVGYLI